MYLCLLWANIRQINKIRKCDLACQLMSAFFFLRANVKRASITADPTRIEVNMHVSFALNNLADQPTEIVRKIQSTWPTYRGHKHFSLSHRVSGDHWFFLNTLILHRVQFFFRTAAHRQTWKYSDLAALLSNGLAHTIYFARLFFIPLPTEFNSIECIFVLCMDLKRNSCKRKPNSTSTTHGQHTRL